VAFCPANMVSGMDFSNDPLLQGRLFSYLDTQLSRLGSTNFHQIPINAPQCPFANHQRDAHMQMAQPTGRVSYEPNTLAEDSPREQPTVGFHSAATDETGAKGRVRAERFADHYSQARQFYRSQNAYEQAHLASALVFELSKVEHPHIREAMVGHLRHIDEDLAQRVGSALGMAELPPAPAAAVAVQDLAPSPALQLIGKLNLHCDRTINQAIPMDSVDLASSPKDLPGISHFLLFREWPPSHTVAGRRGQRPPFPEGAGLCDHR